MEEPEELDPVSDMISAVPVFRHLGPGSPAIAVTGRARFVDMFWERQKGSVACIGPMQVSRTKDCKMRERGSN